MLTSTRNRSNTRWTRRLGVERLDRRDLPSTFTVTNTNDSGTGSLRQAVLNAENTGGPNSVVFEPAVFSSAKTITLTSGEIALYGQLTITGPGARLLTIGGNKASRIFDLTYSYSNISGLKLTDGSGGDILVNAGASLLLQDCILTGNAGGAVAVSGGSLTATRCTFSNNNAGSGGAIRAFSPTSLLLDSCTLSGNVATAIGGAVYLVDGPGTPATIRNCTISGNSAGGAGGAIALITDGNGFVGGNLVVQNSTITNNSGTGVFIENKSPAQYTANYVHASFESTIISGNGTLDVYADPYTHVSLSHCALGTIGSYQNFNPFSGGANISGTPQSFDLGGLQDNDGPTQTQPIRSPYSPLINAGSNPAGLTTDQRGLPRTHPYGGTDIGASQMGPPRIGGTYINGDYLHYETQRSRVFAAYVYFIEKVPNLPALLNAFQVRRQSDNALVSLTVTPVLAADGLVDHVILNFAGGALADGRYTLRVISSQVVSYGNGFNYTLDGNHDGIGGDDYLLASSGTQGIFRLYGDADGNGVVNAADFIVFRGAYGGTSLTFSFSPGGTVGVPEFRAFRSYFGTSI